MEWLNDSNALLGEEHRKGDSNESNSGDQEKKIIKIEATDVDAILIKRI